MSFFVLVVSDKKVSLSSAIPPISIHSPPSPPPPLCTRPATSAHLTSTGSWCVGQSKSSSSMMGQPAFTSMILKSTATIVHPVNTKRWIQYLCHPISARCYPWTTLTCGKYRGPWHTSSPAQMMKLFGRLGGHSTLVAVLSRLLSRLTTTITNNQTRVLRHCHFPRLPCPWMRKKGRFITQLENAQISLQYIRQTLQIRALMTHVTPLLCSHQQPSRYQNLVQAVCLGLWGRWKILVCGTCILCQRSALTIH